MKKDKKEKAIALKYDPEIDQAPRIAAKGIGELARRILKIAVDENIPVVEDPVLISLLDKIQIDYPIPEFLYEVIAELLAFTYNLESKEARSS
ncbi:MAG: EscU/YscU/HrcU family type III secretion system export apparatus switch protein [Spirochaetes bacterium]|nr:EscU/YscU/HrcU family type III secretion system export apparatus switch protein [Spirochaetota bacterium]